MEVFHDTSHKKRKISAKRVILFVLVLMVALSHFSEQWFLYSVDIEKYNSLVGLAEIAVLSVLGDKAVAIAVALNPKPKKDSEDEE